MAKINPEEADLCCDSCEVHENLVKIVNETMPDETELYDLAELFKVFGDSTRIQILFVPKHHRAEKWRVFSCRFRKNLPAFFFYLKKLLSVSGIGFCFFPDHSVLHEIIDMTAGIVMLTVKATSI